jgi:hypothetical protein
MGAVTVAEEFFHFCQSSKQRPRFGDIEDTYFRACAWDGDSPETILNGAADSEFAGNGSARALAVE